MTGYLTKYNKGQVSLPTMRYLPLIIIYCLYLKNSEKINLFLQELLQ